MRSSEISLWPLILFMLITSGIGVWFFGHLLTATSAQLIPLSALIGIVGCLAHPWSLRGSSIFISWRGSDEMKTSDRLRRGQRLPRGSWQGVHPRMRVIPARKGRKAPYRRQPRRRKANHRKDEDDGQ